MRFLQDPIFPIERDRWQVTIHGMADDYPPMIEGGFLARARSLPTPGHLPHQTRK
jgi:hypothetical protein